MRSSVELSIYGSILILSFRFFWNRLDLEIFFSSNAQPCTVPHWRETESSQLLSSAFASVFFFSFVYPEMLLLGAVMVVLTTWSDLELPGWQGSGHTSWGVCILQHDYEHLCWFRSIEEERQMLKAGSSVLWAGILNCVKREKLVEHSIALPLGCECKVTSCLRLLPQHDGLQTSHCEPR